MMRRHSRLRRTILAVFLACVTASGALPVIAQRATPAATSLSSCAGGSSSIGDAYFPMMGNSGYDTIHYDLAFTVDPVSAAIDPAVATITATALHDLCAFHLDFRGMTVDAISVDGQPAPWERFGIELRITPATPIPRGSDFTVEVAYHGTPDGRFADPISVFQEQLARVLSGSPVPDLAAATPLAADDRPADSGYFVTAPYDRALLPPSDGTPTPGVVGGIAAGETTGIGGYYSTGESVFVAGEPWGAETWYPVNAHPADKATYTMHITIPASNEVVANGRLIDRIEHGDSTTWVWEARDPIASYLVTFHAGQLEIEEFTGPDGQPYLLAFHPDTPEAQREAFRRLPEIMEPFVEMFGPYPFESAGATVVGTAIPFALETQTLPIYGVLPEIPGQPLPPDFTDAYMEMVAHELAHQWFGDSVSVLRWQDIWLNEGFATYAQALWLERSQGIEARDMMLDGLREQAADLEAFTVPERIAERSARDLLQQIELYVGEESPLVTDYRDALGVANDEDLATLPAAAGLEALQSLGVPPETFPGTIAPLGNPGPDLLFSPQLTYARGALTLHALREEIGDDAFFDLLRTWTGRYQQGNATTADFISLAETIAGRDLTPFFDEWLYSFG